MESCILCHQESGGESETGTICANCVQTLLLVNQEELQRVYKIAVEKFPVKAEALLNFVGFTITGQTVQRRRKISKLIRRNRCQRITSRSPVC